MLNTILWALLTGGVTGAVWIGVVLLGRQRRLAAEHRELLEDRQSFLDELEAMETRLAATQERLDFVERHLASGSRADPILPPPTQGPR